MSVLAGDEIREGGRRIVGDAPVRDRRRPGGMRRAAEEAVRRPPRGGVVPGMDVWRGSRVRPAACRADRAVARWRVLAGVLVAVCAAMVFLGAVVTSMAGGGVEVPKATAVVEVAPGETMWEVARKYTPQSDPRAVVERIEELNGVKAGELPAGAVLVVPVQAASSASAVGG